MSRFPEEISGLSEAERQRVLNSLPKAAVAEVVASITGSRSLGIGDAMYHDCLLASAVWYMRDAIAAAEALERLSPRVKRVKHMRRNQALVKSWNRLVKRQASSWSAFHELEKHKTVAGSIRRLLADLAGKEGKTA